MRLQKTKIDLGVGLIGFKVWDLGFRVLGFGQIEFDG